MSENETQDTEAAEKDGLVGQKVGNYSVTKLLGKGSMGAVYLGKHPVLDHEVAIKVLAQEFCAYPELVKRFRREARAIAGIKHPAIVQAVDFGDLPDGRSYIIMELLKGQNLDGHMRSRGPLSLEETAVISVSLMEALDVAHKAGFVHRDIKPENIFIAKAEGDKLTPKIIDFGIAKLKRPEGQGDSVVTQIDAVMGTPLYMAPEQGPGIKAEVGPWSDVYSLSCTIFHMLSGAPPFYSDAPMELIIMHSYRPRPDIREKRPDLPEAMSDVLKKGMAQRPSDRYQSMQDFKSAFLVAAGIASTEGMAVPAEGGSDSEVQAEALTQEGRKEQLPGAATVVDQGPSAMLANAIGSLQTMAAVGGTDAQAASGAGAEVLGREAVDTLEDPAPAGAKADAEAEAKDPEPEKKAMAEELDFSGGPPAKDGDRLTSAEWREAPSMEVEAVSDGEDITGLVDISKLPSREPKKQEKSNKNLIIGGVVAVVVVIVVVIVLFATKVI